MFYGKRFDVIYSQGTFTKVKIIRDNETGVAYLSVMERYSGGLCPLLNPNGSPMVYKYNTEKEEK
jgi:hypothetical protein